MLPLRRVWHGRQIGSLGLVVGMAVIVALGLGVLVLGIQLILAVNGALLLRSLGIL